MVYNKVKENGLDLYSPRCIQGAIKNNGAKMVQDIKGTHYFIYRPSMFSGKRIMFYILYGRLHSPKYL